MKSSRDSGREMEEKMVEHGRVIAHGMHLEKMRQEKNMMKAERRRATMLKNAAERALSGGN